MITIQYFNHQLLIILLSTSKESWDELLPDEYGFIPTENSQGFMLAKPDQLIHEFVSFWLRFGSDGVAVDVGAAFGVAVRYALSQPNGGKVIAVDPSEKHLEYLHAHTNAKDMPRLTTIIGSFPNEVKLEKNSVHAFLLSRVLHFL